MKRVDKKKPEPPTVAPGLDTDETLNQNATDKDIKRQDYTEVTRLHLDRTPED